MSTTTATTTAPGAPAPATATAYDGMTREQLIAALAESEQKRAACRKAYVELRREVADTRKVCADLEQRLIAYERRDQHRRQLMRNPQPGPSVKLAGLALIDVAHAPVLDAHALGEGEPDLQKHWRKEIAEATGLSEQCAGDAIEQLVTLGAARKDTQTTRNHRGRQVRTDMLLAPTRALLLAPAQLQYPEEQKPARGGKRVAFLCPECQSDDLQEVRTILRKRSCRACGHTWETEPEVCKPRDVNRDDEGDDDEGEAPAAEEQLPKRPEGDAYPRWWEDGASDWYDPTRPDDAVSQALAWYLSGDVEQAALWYGSLRLRERFRRNVPILTLQSAGALEPEAFLEQLRAWYEVGDYKRLATVARVMGIDASRIAMLRGRGGAA